MQQALWCTLLLAVSAADESKVLDVDKGVTIKASLDKKTTSVVYHVKLHQGGTYVIDMVSANPKALDPYLRVLDRSGELLAADDEGGGPRNSRIVFIAPGLGTYEIVAASVDGAGVGAFTLAVKRDDARLVDALASKVEFLRSRGKYAEARGTAGELLETRRRLKASHWQMIDGQLLVRTLEKVAGFSAQARAELAEAERFSAKGVRLHQRSRYVEAGALYQKGLEVRRRLLGHDHPDTGKSCNNLAQNFSAQGKYAEAEFFFRKALDVFHKRLGEKHPYTAIVANNLAANLNAQGKYAEAGVLYQKALELFRKLLGEEHGHTALAYNNLAVNLYTQGKYAEAGVIYAKALDICRKVLGEEHPDTARSYNALAVNLHAQGKYVEAGAMYEKALDLSRKLAGEEHPLTAHSYNNLAYNLNERGRHAEAAALFEKALDLRRKLLGEEHPEVAQTYNHLAAALSFQGKHAEAAVLIRTALDLRRKLLGEDHPDTAASYNNLALSLDNQGKYAEAAGFFQKALDLHRKLLGEEHPHTASTYKNLADNLHAQGKYAEAENLWASASRVFAVARLRSNQTGFDRAAFAARSSPLPCLTACRARNGKPLLAWQNLEAGLARGLLDELRRSSGPMNADDSRDEQKLLTNLDQLDSRILSLVTKKSASDAKLNRLLAQRRKVGEELAKLEAAAAAREVYNLEHIQSRIPADTAWLAWVDIKGQPKAKDPNGEHWACVLRQAGPPAWVKLPGSGTDGAWTKDDDELPARFRSAVSDPGAMSAADLTVLKQKLLAQRLVPLTPYLARREGLPPVKRLTVVPVGVMAGVPLEALSHDMIISYIPSGTMWARLHEYTNPKRARGTLLAVGDPVFRQGKMAVAVAQRDEAIQRAIRGADLRPLPGSRAEVEAIAQLLPKEDAFKLLGSDASEQRLADLADRGELKKYRYLHFATHGEVNPHVALQSAIVLAQDRLPEPADALRGKQFLDGRLTAAELSHWKLDADMVVLSACQTGLGRPAGGEGYLGFSQVLFLAGARSLVVSLWKVDDTATALLMVRFYENLLGRRAGLKAPMLKAEALAEAKRWLRHLTAKEAETLAKDLPSAERIGSASGRPRPATTSGLPYEHPSYWAAFILIGDPN